MRNLLNNFWPFIFLTLVWITFSFPFFLQNKVPYPANYQINSSAPWSSYEKFLGPVKNYSMPDVPGQIYPWRNFDIESLKNGQIPFWNPYTFSGNVNLANYQSAVFAPLNILFFIFKFIDAWSLLVLIQPLLAGIFTYLFLRSLKVSKVSSLISAVSFMFCGFMTVWMTYGTLDYAFLFLPLSLLSIEKYFQTSKLRFALLLFLTVPLSFFSGHFQISLYFSFFTVSYLIFKSIIQKDFRKIIIPFLCLFFGLLTSMPQLIPSIESYQQTIRSSIFQKIEAIPLSHLSTAFAPDFFGNPVTRNNPAGHYAEWAMFTGIIPLFLSIFAVFFIKSKKSVLFFGSASIISLLFAFNTPFVDLLIGLKIPVLSTAAISRIIVVFSFSIAVLAGLGADELLKEVVKRNTRNLLSLFLISSLILGVAWIFSFTKNSEFSATKNLILPSFLFAVGLASVLGGFLNKKLLVIIPIVFLILTSFDSLRFSTKWMPFDPKANVLPETAVGNFLQKNTSFERVIGSIGQDYNILKKIQGPSGYDPIYIKRYGEFLTFVDTGQLTDPPRLGVSFPYKGKFTKEGLDLLGIKYVVYKKSDNGKAWAFPFDSYPEEKFKIVFEDTKYQIFENTSFAQRTFLTSDYGIIRDGKKILTSIFEKDSKPPKIILEENPGISVGKPNGTATIEKYLPNFIVIKTVSDKDSVLFLSDNYYPGWIARVDGKQTKILRADYTFRAVKVAKGKHAVTFSYEPESFKFGVYLGLLGSVGIVGVVIVNNNKREPKKSGK